MGVFDGLLQGTPGTQTQTSQLAPGAQGLATELFQQTSTQATQPYTAYTGERVANFTPDQLAAFANTRQIAGNAGDIYSQLAQAISGSQLPGMLPQAGQIGGQIAGVGQGSLNYLPGMAAAAGQSGALANLGTNIVPQGVGATLDLAKLFPNANLDQYMNPYVDAVINPAIEDVTRRLAADRANLNSQAAKTGSFGGSRNAVAQALLESEGQREIGRLSADERARAYNEAANQFRLDQQNIPQLYSAALGQIGAGQGLQRGALGDVITATQGAGQVQNNLRTGLQGMADVASLENTNYNRLGQLASANQGLLQSQVNPLLTTGGLQQGMNQTNLDKLYSDFLEQRDWGQRNLNTLRQTLGLGSVVTPTTTSTSNPASPSAFQQIVGGTAALTGALGGISNIGSALGNIFGSGSSSALGGIKDIVDASAGGFLFRRGGLVGVG